MVMAPLRRSRGASQKCEEHCGEVVGDSEDQPGRDPEAPGVLADAEYAAIPGRDEGGDKDGQGQPATGEEVVDAAAAALPDREREQRRRT